MHLIKGDILSIKHGIICHQVNCRGKMGAGIALAIRKKWPIVYKDYMDAYRNHQLVPGAVVMSAIDANRLYVANLCGQLNYGRGKKHTIYKAVALALSKVASFKSMELPVYIPKGMGCNLAGGNWEIMLAIIQAALPEATIVDNKGS